MSAPHARSTSPRRPTGTTRAARSAPASTATTISTTRCADGTTATATATPRPATTACTARAAAPARAVSTGPRTGCSSPRHNGSASARHWTVPMRSRCTVDVEGTPDGLEWWARASCGWSSFRGPRDQADFWAAEHAGEHRAGLVGPRGADRPTPDSVLRSWPAIDPSTWEWLSPHRLRAPHEMVLDAVTLVVVAFGETVGQNLGPGHSAQQVQETYALLFADAARLAAHR